jgi:hypothetical protein
MTAAPTPRLELLRTGASLPGARLERYFHARAEAFALFAAADDAAQRLVRVRWRAQAADGLWIVDAYALQNGRVVRALDRTVFGADAESFAELGRQRERGGPNLHAEPIRLPAELRLAEWCAPFAGEPEARVRLEHAGVVELRLGEAVAARQAICLRAEQAGIVREQWLVEGVGEVALGAPDQPFERWLLGYASSTGTGLFSAPEAGLRTGPWPRLPEPGASGAPSSGTRSLF